MDFLPPAFKPGDLVAGRYQIVRWIASGGMGEVYEADDLLAKTRIALKTLRPDVAAVPGHVERMRRELVLARRRQHPALCQVYDLGVHPASPSQLPVHFLTMELLHGDTLGEWLRTNGPMAAGDTIPVIKAILEGLDALHSAGVLHRDMKADNIFLASREGGERRTVITDFGLALDLGPSAEPGLTQSGYVVGTLEYISPEQLQGRPLTPRSDLYSLGVVVYEMLTGERPFCSESPFSEAARRLYESPPSIPILDTPAARHLGAFVDRCLRLDPADRFSSAEEALGFLREPNSTTLKPTRPISVFPPFPRGLRLTTLGLVAAAAMILSLGWLFLKRDASATDPRNAQAYEFYVRGRALRDQDSLELLKKSVELDPSFAPAWERLGAAYLQTAAPHLQGRAAYRSAENALRKALELDPSNREARLMLPIVFIETGRPATGVRYLERMRKENPKSARTLWHLSYGYRFLGLLEASSEAGLEAIALDRRITTDASWAFNTLLYAGDYEGFTKSLPARVDAYTTFYRGYTALHQGNTASAARLLAEAYQLDQTSVHAQTGKAIQLHLAGDPERGHLILDAFQPSLEKDGLVDGETLYKVGQAYWLLGERTTALAWVERAMGQGFLCIPYIENDPLLKGMWSDPHASEVLQKAKLKRASLLFGIAGE